MTTDAQAATSSDEDWGFEAYVIPKTTYTDYFIPIYVKTKFSGDFWLNFSDSDGNAAGLNELYAVKTDDIVNEWDGEGYKLQNADGRIFGIAFEKTGTYTMSVVVADGYYARTTLAKFKITVDVDSDQAENDYIDWLISSLTNSSMDSFEKMQAIENYLYPKMKYLRGYTGEDGDYAGHCKLLEDYCNPWWKSFVGDSYTTPAILCRIANRVGGFSDVHNCYGDYAPGTDAWKATHYYCKCTGLDKNGVEQVRYYWICAYSNTNLIDAKGASEIPKNDFSDLSGYQKLQQTVSYCRIKFNANGGTISSNDFRTVEKGGKLNNFPSCSKDGYALVGWYTDKGLTSAFDLNTAVNSNIQLYAKWAIDASGATVKVSDQAWTGKALTPAPAVTFGGKTLKQGTDYTVAYSNNVNVGTATAKVEFKGSYTGTAYGNFKIAKTETVGRVTMTRLYNKWSGEHLYTSNAGEVKDLTGRGWRNEGTAWIAPSKSSTPVYRLYNPYSGDHHYTTDKDEYKRCATQGWKQEGIAWYSADAKTGVPLYRGFNRYVTVGTHHYTTSWTEMQTMKKNGWKYEGVAWYGLK